MNRRFLLSLLGLAPLGLFADGAWAAGAVDDHVVRFEFKADDAIAALKEFERNLIVAQQHIARGKNKR